MSPSPPIVAFAPAIPQLDTDAMLAYASKIRATGEQVQARIGDYNHSLLYVKSCYSGPGLPELLDTVAHPTPNGRATSYHRGPHTKGSYDSSGDTAEKLLVAAMRLTASALEDHAHEMAHIVNGMTVLDRAVSAYNRDVFAHVDARRTHANLLAAEPSAKAALDAQATTLNKRRADIDAAILQGNKLAEQSARKAAAKFARAQLMSDPAAREQLGTAMAKAAAAHKKSITTTAVPALVGLVGTGGAAASTIELPAALGGAASAASAGGVTAAEIFGEFGKFAKGGVVIAAFWQAWTSGPAVYDDTIYFQQRTEGTRAVDTGLLKDINNTRSLDPEPEAQPRPAGGGAGKGPGGGCDEPTGPVPGLPDGEYVYRNRGDYEAFWKRVQEQFTGLKTGTEVHYNGVDFDGYDVTTHKLIEAKGNYSSLLKGAHLHADGTLDTSSLSSVANDKLNGLARQLNSQIDAASQGNVKISYRSLNPDTFAKLKAFVASDAYRGPLTVSKLDQWVDLDPVKYRNDVPQC